jgi:translation initiation factor IF-1
MMLISATGAYAASEAGEKHPQLLPGDRVLIGTVEEVRSEQAKIDTGEGAPRFVPMGVRKAKELPSLKKGDRVEITVNDQNLLVDVHVTGEKSHHLVIQGRLAQPLVTGHDKAVIRTPTGKEESHFVRPVARSKVASVPVGVDAVFLIDELNKIVDVTYGSKEAVHRAEELWQKKTPLKGNFSRINAVVLKSLVHDIITVRTEDGKEHPYEVRPLIQKRMEKLSKGDAVVLLVDEENKVTDVAILVHSSEETHR